MTCAVMCIINFILCTLVILYYAAYAEDLAAEIRGSIYVATLLICKVLSMHLETQSQSATLNIVTI